MHRHIVENIQLSTVLRQDRHGLSVQHHVVGEALQQLAFGRFHHQVVLGTNIFLVVIENSRQMEFHRLVFALRDKPVGDNRLFGIIRRSGRIPNLLDKVDIARALDIQSDREVSDTLVAHRMFPVRLKHIHKADLTIDRRHVLEFACHTSSFTLGIDFAILEFPTDAATFLVVQSRSMSTVCCHTAWIFEPVRTISVVDKLVCHDYLGFRRRADIGHIVFKLFVAHMERQVIHSFRLDNQRIVGTVVAPTDSAIMNQLNRTRVIGEIRINKHSISRIRTCRYRKRERVVIVRNIEHMATFLKPGRMFKAQVNIFCVIVIGLRQH